MCHFCSCTGAPTQKGPMLVQCSAVAITKFEIVLSLNLRFVNEVEWGNGACVWAEDISQYACPLLHTAFTKFHEHRIPVNPWRIGVPWNSTTRWEHSIYDWVNGVLTSARGHTFYLKQNLLLTQKEGNSVLRNTKEHYHILSYPYYFPY